MAAKRRISRNKPKEIQTNKYHCRHSQIKHQDDQKPHSWAAVRSLFTCKYLQPQQQEQQQKTKQEPKQNHHKHTHGEENVVKQKHISQHAKNEREISLEESRKKTRCSGSLCSNTKVTQRPENLEAQKIKRTAMLMTSSCNSSNRSMKASASLYGSAVGSINSASTSSSASSSLTAPTVTSPSSFPGTFRNMGFRKLSGCYECRMVVDPVLAMTRDPSLRATIFSCTQCGEIFVKAEYLELHQSVRHAVCELGPDDTSKNIVEIIFQSSWLKKEAPVCKIDRILKVQNTPTTISRFEDYRDTIKTKATRLPKKHPRCLADGNELLRFHCTTLMCSLGLNGSSNLCNSIPTCSVCSIIRNGFKVATGVSTKGILTTATSGKAHDSADMLVGRGKRAMLVCRVIAGRVKRKVELSAGSADDYDSVAGDSGVYSNLDELHVFNPRAILPCFVVIYGGF
ncbi:hypothetical protein F511_20214 [Dorcoceras hygrometricum]|uniref:C2H2-type domain-containing protein n=1 Tax=Dorcoceras hygrometricum TaxID=472368 RepID=A0A2Z7BKL1_9LAMI|nr:hypothetical protein F511_20214 [Dorcoceras hygrometricum]